MARLPTPDELAKLSLRAVVAYALRSARRAGELLDGMVEEETINAPLGIAANLLSSQSPDHSDCAAAVFAAGAIAATMTRLEKPELKQAALCLISTAMATSHILSIAAYPSDSLRVKQLAALARQQAVRAAETATDALATHTSSILAIDAARNDYEVLLNDIGEYDDITLGPPIDLLAAWWERKA
jgi:hypothetical protein